MNHEYYMSQALKEAKLALEKEAFPVGAIVVIDGEIAGRGHRDYSTQFHMDHAEVLALRSALENKNYKRKENDITIYSTLEPCVMCFGTILHTPVQKIVYAAKDPYGGAVSVIDESKLPIRHQGKYPEIVSGIFEQESKALLRHFIETTEEAFWKNINNPLVQYLLN